MSAATRTLRRLLRWLAWVLLGVLVLVLAAVLSVLHTEWGTRFAVKRAMAWYSSGIPGDIRVDALDGAIARGVDLRGLHMVDATGRPLIEIREAHLDLRSAALLRGAIVAERLRIDGGSVHLYPVSTFGDLSRPAPEPKPERIGPDLKVRIEAAVDARSFDVIRHEESGVTTKVVGQAYVLGHVMADGRTAAADIRLAHGRVLEQLTVAALRGEIAWDAPRVTIEDLVAITSVGRIDAAHAELDAASREISAALHGSVLLDALAPDAEIPPDLGEVSVALQAGGGLDGGWVWTEADAGPRLSAVVTAIGALQPDPRAVLDMEVVALPRGAGDVPIRLHGLASLRAEHQQSVRAFFVCTTCAPAVLAAADAHRLETGPWRAAALVWTPGATARAAIRGEPEHAATGSAHVAVDDLTRVRAVVAPWLTLPPMRGSVQARVRCRPEDEDATCRVDLQGDRLALWSTRVGRLDAGGRIALGGPTPRGHVTANARAVVTEGHRLGDLRIEAAGNLERFRIDARLDAPQATRVDLEAMVQRGARTEIELDRLTATRRGVEAKLEGAGRISFDDDELSIEGLAFDVGRGRVAADGRLRRDGPSAMQVDVDSLDLNTVDRLLPGPRLEGTVDLQLNVRGTRATPTGRIDATTRDVKVGELRLGDAVLLAALTDDRLDLRLQLQDGLARRARIEARVPVTLRGGRLEVLGRRRMRLTAVVDALDLSGLGIATPELGGSLDATLRIEGRPASPIIAANVDVRRLSVSDAEIGRVDLVASYLDERATVRIDVQGPAVRRLSAAADLPVVVDLARRRASFDPDKDHRFAIIGNEIHLGAPSRWQEDWPLDGMVDLDVLASGSAAKWEARADAIASQLQVRGQSLGAARLGAMLDPEHLDVGIRASGPAARLLEASVHAPLSIDLRTFEPKWKPRQEHRLVVTLRDAELAMLERLGIAAPVTGRVAGRMEARGSLDEIEGSLDLAAERVAWRSRPLGEIVARLDYDGTTLAVWAHQSLGSDEWIRLDAKAPIAVVDRKPWIRWDAEGHHEAHLHAAGVDEKLLGAFVDLPADVELDAAARAVAHGSIDDLEGAAQIRGSLRRGDAASVPIATVVEVGPRRQSARLLLGPVGPSALRGAIQTQASISELIRGRAELAAVPFEARVDARDFPLLAFEPVLPTMLSRIEGNLHARAEGSGTLGRPDLSGRIEVRDAEVTVVPMHQRLEKGRIVATFDGPMIRLDELHFRSGRGSATAQGRVRLQRGDTHGKASLVAKNLPVVRPGLPLMELDTKLVAFVDTTPDITNVRVVARGTHIDVRGQNVSAPKPIPTSDGVEFVYARGEAPSAPTDGKEPIVARDVRVRFELAEPATILGPDVDMEWDGAVAVLHDEGKVRARGQLSATRGRVTVLGNDFDIEEGEITLPAEGDLDPYVSVVARTEAADAQVTMTVRGRVSRPELRFSSDPAMPESEIFALLVTGSRDAEQGDGSDFETEAASLLAAFQNPALQRTLNERVGIDRVTLGFGEEIEEPIVTVGKRLSRKLYVETQYHHNAPQDENQAEVRLEYRFAPPAWSVETFFGDAAEGGVNLWWRRRFGGDRRTPAQEEPDEAIAGQRAAGLRR